MSLLGRLAPSQDPPARVAAEPDPGPDWRAVAGELAGRLAASGTPCGRHPATAPLGDCRDCGDELALKRYRAAVELADGVTPYPSLIKSAATGGGE
jgi:hypothetical protein